MHTKGFVCACVCVHMHTCAFFTTVCTFKEMCFPGRIFVHGTVSGTVLGGSGEMIQVIDLRSARASQGYLMFI